MIKANPLRILSFDFFLLLCFFLLKRKRNKKKIAALATASLIAIVKG